MRLLSCPAFGRHITGVLLPILSRNLPLPATDVYEDERGYPTVSDTRVR